MLNNIKIRRLNYMSNTNKVVFGIEIGPDCSCKSVGEAFYQRIQNFKSKMGKAATDAEKKQIEEEKLDFIAFFAEELGNNETPLSVVSSAMDICLKEIDQIKEEIEKRDQGKEDSYYITLQTTRLEQLREIHNELYQLHQSHLARVM
jgi:hypothetical protein